MARLILTAVSLVLLIVGCKPAAQVGASATLKEERIDTNCACSDLACWERNTNLGVAEQLKCVKGAADAAANIFSGGTKTFLEVSVGVADVVEALSDKDDDGKPSVDILALFTTAAKGGEIATDLFGRQGSALVQCLKNSASSINNALDLVKSMRDIKKESGAEAVSTFVQAWQKGPDAGIKFVAAMVECNKAINSESINSRAVVKFRKFVGGFVKITGGIKAATEVVKCGARIASGGEVLYKNTMCLIEDLKHVKLSTSTILRAAVGLDYNTYLEGDPTRRSESENQGIACADRGSDGNDHVRRPGSNYISYTPQWNNCLECCQHEDRVKGYTYLTRCVSSCNGYCDVKGFGKCGESPQIERPAPRNPIPDPQPTGQEGVNLDRHCTMAARNYARAEGVCKAVVNELGWSEAHCKNHYNSHVRGLPADQRPDETSCLAYCEHWLHSCCPYAGPHARPESCSL